MGIPIIIPCFNNYIYLLNTIKQLEKINPQLLKSIIKDNSYLYELSDTFIIKDISSCFIYYDINYHKKIDNINKID